MAEDSGVPPRADQQQPVATASPAPGLPAQPAQQVTTSTPAHTRLSAARLSWRARGTAIALLLLVTVNLLLQFDRRFLDVMSSGTGGAAGWATDADIAKAQECESLGRSPDVLLLGSSRAEDGEDAPLIDSVMRKQYRQNTLTCNAAMSGSSFFSDYYMLKRLIEDGLTPKLVVENLFEFNINASVNVDQYATGHVGWLADVSDAADLGSHWGWNAQGAGQTANFLAQRLLPLYGDRIALFKSLCQDARFGPCSIEVPGIPWDCRTCYLTDADHGWRPTDDRTIANHSADEQHALAVDLQFFASTYLHNFQLINGPPRYLVKMVQLAQAHHIRMAFVVSPLHQLYRDLLTPAQWQAIMAYWSTYAQSAQVPFYDQSQAPTYADSDFRDPNHLDIAGAQKFSTWMATTIVGPVLTSGGQ